MKDIVFHCAWWFETQGIFRLPAFVSAVASFLYYASRTVTGTIGRHLKRLADNFRSVVIAEHQFRLSRRILLIVSNHPLRFRDRCLNFDFVDTHNHPSIPNLLGPDGRVFIVPKHHHL